MIRTCVVMGVMNEPVRASLQEGSRGRWGFTLTELLVVIGIIAIALAIVLTILHSAIKAVRALKG